MISRYTSQGKTGLDDQDGFMVVVLLQGKWKRGLLLGAGLACA